MSNEFAKRYGDQGIISTAVNPGNLDSDLLRHLPWWQATYMVSSFYPIAEQTVDREDTM